MTRLTWGAHEDRDYEDGVDRGVVYPLDSHGVVWNGLTAIDSSYVGGEVRPIYFDGQKIRDLPSPRDYRATIKALSAPDKFLHMAGELEAFPGFVVTRQMKYRFHLSWRVMTANGYRIHLVYNALALNKTSGYSTKSANPAISNFEWAIEAVPPAHDANEWIIDGGTPASSGLGDIDGGEPEYAGDGDIDGGTPFSGGSLFGVVYRPTAHLILDSEKIPPGKISVIEDKLYGTDSTQPQMITQPNILDILIA